MSLVFAGICAHGPGITARPERADPTQREAFYGALGRMREAIRASRPDALVVVAAEHFANFFMNNMPSFAVGMADYYDGPTEDPDWLRIPRTRVPGDAALSKRLIVSMMQSVDLTYAEEWKFDHGIMVPLSFLTPDYDLTIIPTNINCQGPPLAPLARAWAFGEALRRAADSLPERIAVVGTGGFSHWPATPDSGKLNIEWDHAFIDRWTKNDKAALLDYNDEAIYDDAGQGGFEIRVPIAIAAAARGTGEMWCTEPIPPFATMAHVGVMQVV